MDWTADYNKLMSLAPLNPTILVNDYTPVERMQRRFFSMQEAVNAILLNPDTEACNMSKAPDRARSAAVEAGKPRPPVQPVQYATFKPVSCGLRYRTIWEAFNALETDIRHSLEFVRTPGIDLRFTDDAFDDSPGVESWDN